MTTPTINPEAVKLAVELLDKQTMRDELSMRVNYPQCGKPGKGYKAARKLRPLLAEAELRCTDATRAINDWVKRGKASRALQERRRAMIKEALVSVGG